LEDKITAAPVLTVLHSSHLSPPLKLGESKTTLGSDSSQAHPSYVVCPRSSCSGLAEEWDVNWWHAPLALLTQENPFDVQ